VYFVALDSAIARIDGVGDVLLEKSSRAKRLILSVRPFRGARVAVPKRISFKQAALFAASKAPWIERQLANAKTAEQKVIRFHRQSAISHAQARRQIVGRLNQLSRQTGLTYNRVFVRNQKTRWGSCSARNNINLNINLAHLPVELMDYIILHELAHTRITNHGPQFWKLLGDYIQHPREHDRALNQYDALLTLDADAELAP
jgi:predicted metal-dependent hydrolase